ncbi:MAG TPA: dephospho-CoA kinase [Candidatus Limnocylindrales bacterium]
MTGASTKPGAARGVRIGLTGPIGCGKTTVAGWLAARGATVVDADALTRLATAPGEPALDAVIARFGEAYRRADGSLDRPALGRLVFADPVALRDLEAIVHPAVRRLIVEAVERAEAAGAPAVVLEAIKLVESGLAAQCDEVWLVRCEPAVQRARLLAKGWTAADADQRIAAQGDLAARLRAAATRLIGTDGQPGEVEAAVADAYAAVLRARVGRETGPG